MDELEFEFNATSQIISLSSGMVSPGTFPDDINKIDRSAKSLYSKHGRVHGREIFYL